MLQVVGVLLGLGLGVNQHLAQGLEALDALDYQKAETELSMARTEPGLSRGELLSLLEGYGRVEAILGHHDAAVAAFREVLNLNPLHMASANWAPKIRTPYFEAKSWQVEHPTLQVKPRGAIRGGGRITALRFEVVADPLGLTQTLRVHLSQAPAAIDTAVSAVGMVTVTVPADATSYWAEALDAQGATLLSLGSSEHVLAAVDPADPALRADAPVVEGIPRLKIAGAITAGVGVVGLAVGTVFALQVRSDQQTLTNAQRNAQGAITSVTRAQAIQLDSQAKSDAVIADTLFAAGAVAMAAGAGLWIGGMFVGAAPEPKGAIVAVAARWP